MSGERGWSPSWAVTRRLGYAGTSFARPDIYNYLEQHDCLYAIRLPSNEVLQREIIFDLLELDGGERIHWLSPLKDDE